MDYTEITTLALSYADRQDQEVSDRIDDFLKIVEARINRSLRVANMSVRATLPAVVDQEYYGLPADFGSLRDVEVQDSTGASRVTLKYLSPEQMNNLSNVGAIHGVYYTLVAQQIQIFPPQENKTIEIIYYQKLPPLSPLIVSNWLSDINPDCYVFGLLVEISSFIKDAQASTLWEQRFSGALESISHEDAEDRWSGTALEIRIG